MSNNIYLCDKLFTINKYTTIYLSLMKSSKERKLNEEIYIEKHHIIPKSLGGSNDSNNIAILTGREHFLAHLLLTKITIGKAKQKMWLALNRMLNSKQKEHYKLTSRTYEIVRKNFSNLLQNKFIGKNNPAFGKPSSRRKSIIFNNIEFSSREDLYKYGKSNYNLSKFVIKSYIKRYPEIKSFEDYITILQKNNENSRLAGRKNKNKVPPNKGKKGKSPPNKIYSIFIFKCAHCERIEHKISTKNNKKKKFCCKQCYISAIKK